MNRLVTLLSVTLLSATAALTNAEEKEAKDAEITTFETVQQNKDYRITLLGVTKGIAFVDSQEPIDGGDRAPGKNAVPWIRVFTVIENLTDRNEPWRFQAETDDGRELVSKVRVQSNGHVVKSRANGLAEMDFNFPGLRKVTFPVDLPAGLDATKAKVYAFTLSGQFERTETFVLRFSFGDDKDRRELKFNEVPLP